ncbi:U4/U6 small nuclear ribonucleoprotein PRP4-like protein [Diplonema papillatum]|nr:U4/U6 small nuclear ribonucleoprotein PRP4-like protein [Diplonema papillatum]WGM49970.1 PRP4 [Diplonema papillatum]
MNENTHDPRPEEPELEELGEEAQAAARNRDAAWREIQHRETLRSVEHAVPVLDPDVRKKLRELGEPITLFGEGPYERRLRLRKVIADASAAGQEVQTVTLVASKAEVKTVKKRFFTEGSEALKQARIDIATFSLSRAKTRVQRQKLEWERAKELSDSEQDVQHVESIADIKRFVGSASQEGGDRPLSNIKVSPNGKYALIASWDQFVRLFTIPECTPAADHCAVFGGHANRVTGIAWRPGATTQHSSTVVNFASCGSDKSIKLWSLDKGEALATFGGHTDRVNKIAYHPTGDFLATTSHDGTWRLWDVTTGRSAYCLLEQEGHSEPTSGIDIQCDGSLAAVSDLSGIVRVWDLRSGKSVFLLEGHMKQVTAVAFSPCGWQLCTGGHDNLIKAWDLRRQGLLTTITAHSHLVSAIAFEPNEGKFFASASFDNTISLWSADTFELVKTLRGHDNKVMGLDISPTDSSIVSCGFDRTWKLWEKRGEGIDALNSLLATVPAVDDFESLSVGGDVAMHEASGEGSSGDEDGLDELE